MDNDGSMSKSLVFIQLGRAGDLLILLPCWRKIAETTGEPVTVVVAREFAELLRGVTYVKPDIVNVHWYGGIPQATLMARLKYPQGFTVTQCDGWGHHTDHVQYPTFGEAMWSKAGFPGRYGELPLVFDRRNPEREAALVRRARQTDKPLLLYNFRGLSSPLLAGQAILHRLRRYALPFELLNLGDLRAQRLYDLLGLYDIAAGLVSIDTATSHLAAASSVPLLAYCRGGWSSMIPKNGAMKVWYKDAEKSLDLVDKFVQSLAK